MEQNNSSSLLELECLLARRNKSSAGPGNSEGGFCPSSWDGHFCWPESLAGTNVTKSCSQIQGKYNNNGSSFNSSQGSVFRFCTTDAEWEANSWGNYSSCEELLRLTGNKSVPFSKYVGNVLFYGSMMSLICLMAALFLFYYFRRIRCDRVTIHMHFMWALALKCVFFMIITQPVIFKSSVSFRKIEWICKIVLASQLYTYLASINWMFVEGHYLNSKLSTHIFAKKPPMKIYYLFGWGVSLLTILIWCIVMDQFHEPTRCWKGYGKSKLIWLFFAPMLAVLLANIVFLGNVIRVMITKLQLTSQESEGQQIRRGVKTTLFLFPLLGLNILLFFVNPGGSYQPYYMLGNAILHSSQGMFVAVLYCFISPDVREAVRREWTRMRSIRESRFSGSNTTCLTSISSFRNSRRHGTESMI